MADFLSELGDAVNNTFFSLANTQGLFLTQTQWDICIQSPDRETLLKYLVPMMVQTCVQKTSVLPACVTCTGPCGTVKIYHTVSDIPYRSDECLCGKLDRRHWFIHYTTPWTCPACGDPHCTYYDSHPNT